MEPGPGKFEPQLLYVNSKIWSAGLAMKSGFRRLTEGCSANKDQETFDAVARSTSDTCVGEEMNRNLTVA